MRHIITSVFDQLALLAVTIVSVFLAFVGGLARLIHESAHDRPITYKRVLLTLPAALVLGVVGHALGEWLSASYALPRLAGGALAGVLGYLGPIALETIGRAVLKRIESAKEK